jgi:hypothetical protein
MENEKPIGQLFSRVYLKRGEPTPDSTRMRNRIGVALRSAHLQEGAFERRYDHYRNPSPNPPELKKAIEAKLGIHIPWSSGYPDWKKYASTVELRDVLDTVTILASYGGKAWIEQARSIFLEENVCYSIDEKGGVHLSVDQEFNSQRLAAISVLSASRYDNVRQQFEAAYSALDQIPSDGKAAMRANFHALEGLYRLMFPAAPRLAKDAVTTYLKPLLNARHNGDQTAQRAASKAVQSFQEWVDTMHYYRHEPGSEEPAQPPLSLAVLAISQGANWLRWLAELDQESLSKSSKA